MSIVKVTKDKFDQIAVYQSQADLDLHSPLIFKEFKEDKTILMRSNINGLVYNIKNRPDYLELFQKAKEWLKNENKAKC